MISFIFECICANLEGVGRVLVERVALVIRTDLAVNLHIEGGVDVVRGIGQETALRRQYRRACVQVSRATKTHALQ